MLRAAGMTRPAQTRVGVPSARDASAADERLSLKLLPSIPQMRRNLSCSAWG